MWSAISSYLGEPAPTPPATPRRSPPNTPRKLTAIMTSSYTNTETIRNSTDTKHTKTTIGSTSNVHGVSNEKVAILRGTVVGTSSSGKTCLLRRLRGEDISVSSEDKRKLMALLPWKVSNTVDCIDKEEVVQLYISESVGFSLCGPRRVTSEENNDKEHKINTVDDPRSVMHREWKDILHHATRKHTLDFIVWMVDTRHCDAETVVEFVKMGLECLYCDYYELSENENDANQSVAATVAPQSLCILLNFRDEQTTSILQIVRETVGSVLAELKIDKGNTGNPSVLVYESSMLTNYGILELQSFITLPYLLYKEKEYLRRVREVRRGYNKAKCGLLEDEERSYEDYLKQTQNDSQKITASSPKRRQSAPKRQSSQSKVDKSRVDSPDPSQSNETHLEEYKPDGRPRQLFPRTQQSKPTWTPLDSTHQNNLDSFFSDDESSKDDEEAASSTTTDQQDDNTKNGSNLVLDSDDESTSIEVNDNGGDEFYIDNNGDRVSSEKADEKWAGVDTSDDAVTESEEKKDDQSVTNDSVDVSNIEDTDGPKIQLDVDAADDNTGCSTTNAPERRDDSSNASCDVQNKHTISENDEHTALKAYETENMSEEESIHADLEPAVDSRVNENAATNTEDEDASAPAADNVVMERDSSKNFDAPADPESNNATQFQVVLDSDDESDNVQSSTIENRTAMDQSKNYDEPNDEVEPPLKATTSITKEDPVSGVKTAPTVSNAALAAIEAARLEAQRALDNANDKPKEKKLKTEKKKSKAKKSKAKKSKKKESKA